MVAVSIIISENVLCILNVSDQSHQPQAAICVLFGYVAIVVINGPHSDSADKPGPEWIAYFVSVEHNRTFEVENIKARNRWTTERRHLIVSRSHPTTPGLLLEIKGSRRTEK